MYRLGVWRLFVNGKRFAEQRGKPLKSEIPDRLTVGITHPDAIAN
jgi:hypothetical protein